MDLMPYLIPVVIAFHAGRLIEEHTVGGVIMFLVALALTTVLGYLTHKSREADRKAAEERYYRRFR